MNLPPPAAEEQLCFLTKIQRLFAEGDFTATYKFALIISLVELAVERGEDNGNPLEISISEIADKFIDLYWQQATPYCPPGKTSLPRLLSQNNGQQAAILSETHRFRQSQTFSTADAARKSKAYQALRGKVAKTVSDQPARYLQNIGSGTDEFIFKHQRGSIALNPGVAYCMRRFQPLLQRLARTHWIEHIKRNRRNVELIGDSIDLEEFLFETSRQTLNKLAKKLGHLDAGRCFYCRERIHIPDVDHFIPFAMYPRDAIHNFVLAHPACNRSKSDTLAAHQHLARWVQRIASLSDDIQEIGHSLGVSGDKSLSEAVAKWAYSNAYAAGASSWIKPRVYEQVRFESALLLEQRA